MPIDPFEALDRARQDFQKRLDAVADDDWDKPTPCTDWNVRELVHHVIGGNRMATIALSGATREDNLAALRAATTTDERVDFASTSEAQAAAFREPGALERVVQHPRMDMPGSLLLSFRTGDLAVHAWDLARAIGADEALDADVVEALYAGFEPIAPIIGQSGAFGSGASGEVPADAPLQTRLLDILGRRV